MRTRAFAVAAVLCALLGAAVFLAAQQPETPPAAAGKALEQCFSPMPVLYLQVKDAAGLIERFQKSARKPGYEKGRNFEDFQKSKLYNKLGLRVKSIEETAGFGITLDNLKTFLGKESGLWLYDIQELKFVAATSIPESRFAASALAKVRQQFEQRQGDGFTYSVREGKEGGITLAFARLGDTLVFGNDLEPFLAVAGRLKGGRPFWTETRAAFREAFDPAFSSRDITLFLTKKAIQNLYFRNYWIFRNSSELAWIDTALVDFGEEQGRWTERRIYNPDSRDALPAAAGRDLNGMAAFLPANPYYAKLVAEPRPLAIAGALGSELFPDAMKETAAGGRRSTDAGEPFPAAALCEILGPAKPSGWGCFLEGWFREDLFPAWNRLFIIELQQPGSLDRQALERFFTEHFRRQLTVGQAAAANLRPKTATVAGRTVWYLQPPLFARQGIAFAVAGNHLLVSTRKPVLERFLAKRASPHRAPSPASGFISADINRIRADYRRTVDLLAAGSGWQDEDTVPFFTQNIPSLAQWASTVQRFTLLQRVENGRLCETVSYLRAP